MLPNPRLEEVERFWSRVQISRESDCWLWTGATTTCNTKYPTPMTYGAFSVYRDGKQHTRHAHRWAWIILYGEPPKGLVICHSCDEPLCCNPYHLFAATRAVNQRDMQDKLRSGILGVKNPKAKVTEDQVREIRASVIGTSQLARQYGLDPSSVWKIRSGKYWRHVT